MDVFQHVRILLHELPDASEAIQSVSQRDEHHWTLSCLQQRLTVEVELNDVEQEITLVAPFAPVEAENRLRTYETMLQLNGTASDNHGLRMGLDDRGTAIQLMDLPLGSLDLPQLRSLCDFFIAKAAFWSILMARGGLADGEDLPQTDDVSGTNAIRI